jgi:hypothetical protein
MLPPVRGALTGVEAGAAVPRARLSEVSMGMSIARR